MQNFSWLSRTALLTGDDKLKILSQKKVLIVGLGGIGSFAAEAIARAGVKNITIVDGDSIEESNKNRQLVALDSTEGKLKAEVMAERMRDINPEINLTIITSFLNPEDMEELVRKGYDYILECIDSITPKVTLIALARKSKTPIICSGGAGGKLDPTKVRVANISKVFNCKLTTQVRKRLKSQMKYLRGINVVFSEEEVDKNSLVLTDGSNFKKSAYGTMSYLPAVFGLTVASVAIRDLLKN
ncbi:tRNA threonylcarbamoyladenosine dehydratase [Flavobacteriaceae bacterium]|nr:tRNA threonylcarbamoyladenosine dehydratase [Flavobacteriaceae bacterium]